MKYSVIILSFFLLINHYSQNKEDSINGLNCMETKFILIANVGISNYSLATLIISTDSIKEISNTSISFEDKLKYYGCRNIIIDRDKYCKLFNFLNVTKSHNNLKNKSNKLIIKYRNKDNKNYNLIVSEDISSVLFTLKSIYYYVVTNNYPEEVIEYLYGAYNFFVLTYGKKEDGEGNLINDY